MDGVICIIPSRYGSQRFPGKPLAMIAGRPMILRTLEAARKAKTLSRIYVATDHELIADTVRGGGGEAIMTSSSCPNGTSRVVEAFEQLPQGERESCRLVVNVQGDEPGVSGASIDAIVEAMLSHDAGHYSVGTAMTRIHKEEDAINPNIVKVVVDNAGGALYFSRAMIPSNKQGRFRADVPYWRHIGIYAYRPPMLQAIHSLPPSPLQDSEDLEQLQFMSAGYKIRVVQVEEAIGGIDVPADVDRIEAELRDDNN